MKVKLFWMLLAFSSVTLFFSCKNNSQTLQDNKKIVSSKDVQKDSILSYEVLISKKDPMCLKWNYPKKDEILFIIKKMDTITPQEWNYYFGVFPCDIIGDLFVNGKRWHYQLNAGGWIQLMDENDTTWGYNSKTHIYLGCSDKSLEKYFLSTRFDDKDFGD